MEYVIKEGCVVFFVGTTEVPVLIETYKKVVLALQKGPISVVAVGPKGETLALRADRKAALYVPIQQRAERDAHLEEILIPLLEEMPPLWGVRIHGVSVRKDEHGDVEVLTPAGWEKR